MRIRTVKPEFWISESVGRLSRDSRLTFIGLWSVADDHGRFRADPRYLAGQLYPYDADGLEVINVALAELVREGSITVYEADRSTYGVLTGWRSHQKIDRPSASKLPGPPVGQVPEIKLANIREGSTRAREASCEDQGRDQGSGKGSGIRDQGEEAPPASAAKPARKKTKAQGELPAIAPAPPPRPPTRIGKLHEYFQLQRGYRLTDEPPDGLGFAEAVPDEAPNWGMSAATLTSWCSLFQDWSEEDQDRAVRGMINLWLLEPYWASPTDKKTGQPSTPFPWGAFITEKQWRKAYEKLTADDPKAGAA